MKTCCKIISKPNSFTCFFLSNLCYPLFAGAGVRTFQITLRVWFPQHDTLRWGSATQSWFRASKEHHLELVIKFVVPIQSIIVIVVLSTSSRTKGQVGVSPVFWSSINRQRFTSRPCTIPLNTWIFTNTGRCESPRFRKVGCSNHTFLNT